MEKRWAIKETDNEKVQQLQAALQIPSILIQLLVQRGIYNYEDSKKFFRPLLEHLHDPFLMKDMDKAIDRIISAINNKEKILVYGDYDVDGTTSVATVFSFLKEHEVDADYYIPNRYTEGYGISFKGIDFAKENGFSLVIALDCGIKANDKIDYANERNIDFIICDHHLPGDQMPKAVAVLDPKRKDCDYPYKELSGCGIGFKLISALAKRKHIHYDKVNRYLDFVAVSIASDIVHITGENRVLAFYGLKKINSNPSEGLKALIELNAAKKALTISDVVFQIGPRINAAGRMDDAKHAVQLLISGVDKATSNAQVLNDHNFTRKDFDKTITLEAKAMLEGDPEEAKKRTTVLYKSEWHKGVIGIVASRLIETWYRPTIILTESNGMIGGSARSVAGFDVYEAINSCSDLLEQFGGHMYAAGLSLKPENLEAFKIKFEKVVASTITEQMLTPEIEINAVIDPVDVTPKFYNILNQFAPFGPMNMKPVFATYGVVDTKWSKVVGNDHLKLSVKKNEKQLNGIAFGMGEKFAKVQSGEPFDVCYTLEENEWNGKKSIEMLVRDIR